jgi:hypothetical protein
MGLLGRYNQPIFWVLKTMLQNKDAPDIPSLVSSEVSAWQNANLATLTQAYPMDWNSNVLYAEWQTSDYDKDRPGKKKKPVASNGFSNEKEIVESLRQRILSIETKCSVVIDHIYVNRDARTITTLWHTQTGPRVREYGTAPLDALKQEV